MPHEAIREEWDCPFCPETFDSKEKAVSHIQDCKYNPLRRHCGFCIHACSLVNDRITHSSDCYCGYHHKKYNTHPYNIDCERETSETGRLVPIKRTCKHWSYKGEYAWTPISEYEDTLREYEKCSHDEVNELSSLSVDPIHIGSPTYQCDYCDHIDDDLKFITAHEKRCKFNPSARNCGTCIHSGSKPNPYGWYGTPEHPLTHYCLLYDIPFYAKPYLKNCEVSSDGRGGTMLLRNSCKDYEYQGCYDWKDR